MYRAIPSIEQLRQRTSMRVLEEQYGRAALTDALRAEAAAARQRIAAGPAGDVIAEIEQGVAIRLATDLAPSLRRVVNATGVIVHTNLGRAPLSRAAVTRIASLATGYTNLEYDLAQGRRGRRDVHADRLICRITGAAASLVVNNNAAATMLVLAALGAGREVIISRGELVEIGGGFRVPDVMALSGALLREVGTTNRTRAADYAAAIGPQTALILRVHPSNFRIEGFTERPSLEELVALGHRFGIPVVEDLGSGLLLRPVAGAAAALGDEPVVQDSVAAGADAVMFSGDKLLGGPQAGIIAGTREALSKIRAHPLLRALRVGKLTYAALEATLEDHAAGRAEQTVPVAAMIAMPIAEINRRAIALAEGIEREATGVTARVIDGVSTIGGGSAPGSAVPTRLVAIIHPAMSADALLTHLRAHDPPVIARIEDDRVVLDLRTIAAEDDVAIVSSITGQP